MMQFAAVVLALNMHVAVSCMHVVPAVSPASVTSYLQRASSCVQGAVLATAKHAKGLDAQPKLRAKCKLSCCCSWRRSGKQTLALSVNGRCADWQDS